MSCDSIRSMNMQADSKQGLVHLLSSDSMAIVAQLARFRDFLLAIHCDVVMRVSTVLV